MSTLRSSFNPAAWDFKPRQAEGWPMPADVKASPSACDTQKSTLPDNNVSTWQPIPPIPEGCPGNASYEELRLKDYNQGKGKLNVNGAATFKPSTVPSVSFPAGVSSSNKKILDLLCGSGIDIHIGNSELPCDQWSLPINLISHYSLYLKAASTPNDEGPIAKVNLPEHDAAVFGLFVEWMYYGRYDATSTAADPHIHGKCWILGDKLQCPEFKNYVMGLLYTQHITLAFAKSITREEVQYVCDNTSSNAKLRQFYENFVVKYYATTDRLQGSTEEWDALFQKHSAMRFALLQSMRHGFTGGSLMRDVSEYLEPTEGLLKPDIKPAEGLLNLDPKPTDRLLKPNPKLDEDSTTSPTNEETGEPAQPVKLKDGLQWTFDPKLDKTASGSPSSIEIEEKEEKEKEEEKETQTIVDHQVQDEVRGGASIMHHAPQVDIGSLSIIKGNEQEDTDETLVNVALGPKSKKKKWRHCKAKGHLVNKTLELSVRDDQQIDYSSSGHESEQVSTEQTEAEAAPESAEDEDNFSTDSEPDSFADLVKANRERQETGLPNV
ncbi:Ff.00g011770.m01.CDS01 [Fusarium sp. VM40]|nr:Ff.00g011770.m01.CDS01 [Fusarium sp. VM40]